jgi:hypothetical protein
MMRVQTLLPDHVLRELKKKTGERYTKDALAKAIFHYLECPYALGEDPLTEKLRATLAKKGGSCEGGAKSRR